MGHALANTQYSKTTTHEERPADQLDTMYRSTGRQLWASFYAFCGDAERASDALQESFLRLQQQDLSAIRNPRSWLRRVGRNWLRDVARRTKRSALIDAHLPDCTDPRENASQSCERSEIIETVRCALNHLCEPDRLALSLRYGMKWPSSRIAKTLGTTPQAADMRLCRARIRLREVLLQMQPDFALSAL
ncbi:MAG: sigma-70 family RNA polymerase sigma factor [Fuerstiella sp.]|nr:sigma-70 family RNA polymerase sigma factor [Fuerstiella sp.]MCP4855395.1 sigma-70 family RNA polymerase sigma factor [Fuerstiella sp.]